MKNKFFLILLHVFLMFSGTAMADVRYITIGDGNSTSSWAPYYNYYSFGYYSTTQSLYTANEIGTTGTINKIAYYVTTADKISTSSVEIYMGRKASESFSSASDFLRYSSMTLVYSGRPVIGEKVGWEELELQTPYNYTGGSLVVVVCKRANTYSSTLTYKSTETRGMCLYRGSSDTFAYSYADNTSYSYNTCSWRPNVRFEISDNSAFTENGISYKILSEANKTVEVIQGITPYQSIVRVPETVAHNGYTYNVMKIGKDAFYGSSVSYVQLTDKIQSVGQGAFKDCKTLVSINLPSTLTEIGTYAFYGCTALKKINIPEGITSIPAYSFYGCESLTELFIPSNIQSIDQYAFIRCNNLGTVTVDSPALIETDTDDEGWNNFPYGQRLVVGPTPTKIGKYRFYDSGLREIIIPNNIVSIGQNALCYCSNLKKVYIDVPSIVEKKYSLSSNDSFKNIFGTQVESYTIGGSCKQIGDYAFYGCTKTSEVVVEEGVKSIGYEAFYYLKNLKSISLPSSIKEIGEYCFSGCEALEKVNYASIESLCKINFKTSNSNPLSYAHNLYINGEEATEIAIPNSLTRVLPYTFIGGKNIKTVHIPSSITEIGEYAFYNCGITSIDIPSSVKIIGNYAFMGCSELTKAKYESIEDLCTISFGNSYSNPLMYAGHLFIGNEEITSLIIPNSITEINDYTFNGAKYITEIKNLGNITSIGRSAFENCWSLESIVFSDKTTTIKQNAFCGCSKIKFIEFGKNIKDIGDYAFNCYNVENINALWIGAPPTLLDRWNVYNSTNIILHVYEGMAQNYSSMEYWKNFTIVDDIEYQKVNDITFGQPNYSIGVGELGQLTYNVHPSNALIKDVTWSTDDDEVAFVDPNSGDIIGLSDGVATIKATSKDIAGYSATVRVYVGNVPAPTQDVIFLNKSNMDLCVGKTSTLVATQETISGTNKVVTWTSSDNNVASVNNGIVTGISEGTATITASIAGGASVMCNVTVYAINEELVDGTNYSITSDKECNKLTFSKTFSASSVGKWNAFFVPMSIDVEEYAGELDFAEIYSFCATVDTNGDGTVDANDENFLFVRPVKTGCIEPNVPYLIRPKAAKTYVINSADNILYKSTEGKVEFSTTLDKFTVTGLNNAFTVTAGDNNYYVSASGALNIRTTGSTTVKANRWIMHRESKKYGGTNDGTSYAREYRIVTIGEDMDETTAIETIRMSNASNTESDDVYTIDGRRVNTEHGLSKGIYIKNGKKYFVK